MVAQYADSCNLFPGPELPHKLAVLREHCERLGRDYDAIERTTIYGFDLGGPGEHEQRVEQTLTDLRALADLGIQVAHGRVESVHDLTGLRLLGERVIPEIASW
jgi:alkanesulfonate monooxygenase